MSSTRKQYSPEFKAKIVLEMLREEKTIGQIASEYGVHPNVLTKWKRRALEQLPSLFDEHDRTADLKAEHQRQMTELYAEIGRLTTHVAWLKRKSGIEHVGL